MAKIEPGKWCPLIRKDCVGLKWAWYMQVRGMNPNTGEDIDEWGCAVTWMPIMTIENSQQQRHTSSAVESFRNEVVKANESNRDLYIQGLMQQPGVIPVNVTPLTSQSNNILQEGDSTDESNNN